MTFNNLFILSISYDLKIIKEFGLSSFLFIISVGNFASISAAILFAICSGFSLAPLSPLTLGYIFNKVSINSLTFFFNQM